MVSLGIIKIKERKLKKGKGFLKNYLGGDPFVIKYTFSKNRPFITTNNNLANTGVNNYKFISKKLVKILINNTEFKVIKGFKPV